jgi:hypothetical protein
MRRNKKSDRLPDWSAWNSITRMAPLKQGRRTASRDVTFFETSPASPLAAAGVAVLDRHSALSFPRRE